MPHACVPPLDLPGLRTPGVGSWIPGDPYCGCPGGTERDGAKEPSKMAGFLHFSVIFISYSSYFLKWFEYIWMMSKWCNWFFDKLTDGEPQFWGRYTWNILEYHTVEDPSARKFTGATICWRIRVAHHISWAEIQPLSSVTAREPNCCLELAAITIGTVGTVTCMLHACYSTSWKRTTRILRVVSCPMENHFRLETRRVSMVQHMCILGLESLSFPWHPLTRAQPPKMTHSFGHFSGSCHISLSWISRPTMATPPILTMNPARSHDVRSQPNSSLAPYHPKVENIRPRLVCAVLNLARLAWDGNE